MNDARVDDLLERWADKTRIGEPVSVDDLCANDPALVAEVTRRMAILRRFEALLDPEPNTDASPDAALTEGSTPLPARIGDFTPLGVLGEGGMGTVFLAEDRKLRRKVAVKVMKRELAANPSAKLRFLREARSMAAVEHDNVMAILSVGEADETPFLVMPVLKGETLQARLQSSPQPPIADVCRIGREIAAGLAAAHEQGLIHRDIKPGNIWLEASPAAATGLSGSQSPTPARVKVLDFGLARVLEGDQQISHSGTLVGTPSYMSPEQASGRHVDARSDLFSLGCVLYEMVTGKRPFQGPTMMAVLSSLANERPTAANTVRPETPQALSDLIEQLLQKDPDSRPRQANDVVEALARIETSAASLATQSPSARQRRWNHWMIAGLAVSAVGIFGLVAVLMFVRGGNSAGEQANSSKTQPVAKTSPPVQPSRLSSSFDQTSVKTAQRQWAANLGEKSPVVTNSIDMKLVLIPPGKFTMGSPMTETGRFKHEDQVQVTLTQPFYLGTCEVTQGEWKAVMGIEPWMGKTFVKEGKNHAATFVNWDDAMSFCRKLTERERKSGALPAGWEYTLPTEAQWEYACRGGSTSRFHFGARASQLANCGWFIENSKNIGEQYAHPVGKKQPNAFGLYDMHGNVWEWCRDAYGEDPPGGTDPAVTHQGSSRVHRGGSWFHPPRNCRSAIRAGSVSSYRSNDIGFRVARVPIKK